jgi:hypothetical protein
MQILSSFASRGFRFAKEREGFPCGIRILFRARRLGHRQNEKSREVKTASALNVEAELLPPLAAVLLEFCPNRGQGPVVSVPAADVPTHGGRW